MSPFEAYAQELKRLPTADYFSHKELSSLLSLALARAEAEAQGRPLHTKFDEFFRLYSLHPWPRTQGGSGKPKCPGTNNTCVHYGHGSDGSD